MAQKETLQRKITFHPYLVSGSVLLPRVFSWTLECRSSLLIFYQQQEKYCDRNVLVWSLYCYNWPPRYLTIPWAGAHYHNEFQTLTSWRLTRVSDTSHHHRDVEKMRDRDQGPDTSQDPPSDAGILFCFFLGQKHIMILKTSSISPKICRQINGYHRYLS